MKFRKRRNRNEKPIEIMLTIKIIPSKKSTQFWGMTLDSRLNQEEHIYELKAKAKRALNTIMMVAGKMGRRLEIPKRIVQCNMQDKDGL